MSTKNDIVFSLFAEKTQKVVFSKTLEEVKWRNTKLITENIAEEISKMNQQPRKNLALVGGAGIAQTFMKLSLIDEYLIILFIL